MERNKPFRDSSVLIEPILMVGRPGIKIAWGISSRMKTPEEWVSIHRKRRVLDI
jgi:hypothetical protein